MKKKNLIIIAACSVIVLAAVIVSVILLGNKGCKHEWGEWTVVTEATCSAEGSQKHVCSKCNEEELGVIAKVDHKYGEYVQDKGSCMEDITKSAYCVFECGEKKTIVVDNAPGHNYEVCGYTSLGCEHNEATIYTCTKCGDSYEVIENVATGHNVLSWSFQSETKKEGTTCTYVQVYTGRCNVCNAPIEKEETVEKHEYTVKITKEATCSELGIRTYECIHCDDKHDDEYENLDAHQYDSGVKNGNIITYTCLHSCGHSKTAIDAKEEIETTVAVEDLANNEVELKNASIALDESTLSNLLSSDVKLAADTLATDDRNEIVNNLSEEQKEQLGDSKIFNFTMEADGNAVTEFGGKVTVTIDYELAEGEDPNNIAIWYLMDDGSVEAIPASYANGKVTFETSHFSYYSVTRLSQRERCALYGHVHNTVSVEATCTTDGYDLNVCRLCGDTSKSNIVLANGHDFESQTVNPTCTEHGKTTYTCKDCNFNYSKVIGSTGHSWTEVENIPATTEADGVVKYECSECHKTRERVLPKLEVEVELKPEDTEIIESILKDLSKHEYTIKLENFEYHNEYDESYSIKNAEGYITISEDGKLSGYFTGILKYEDTEYSDFSETTAIGYIEDNKVYIKVTEKENGYLDDLDYFIVDIEGSYAVTDTQGEMSFSNYLIYTFVRFIKDGILTDWYENSFMKIVNKVEETNSEELKEFKAVLMENLFKLTENENGYELALRVNQLDEALTYLTETSIYDLLVAIFGEKTLTNLDSILSFSVDKLIKELELRGIVLDDVIACLDELIKVVIPNLDLPEGVELPEINSFEELLQIVTEDDTFDLDAILKDEEIRKISVGSLLEQYTEMTQDELKQMAEEYLEGFKELKLIDMIPFHGPSDEAPKPDVEDLVPHDEPDSSDDESNMNVDFIETMISLIQTLDENVEIKVFANKECQVENIKLTANVESEKLEDFEELICDFLDCEMCDLNCNVNIIADYKSNYDLSYVKDEALEFDSMITEEVFKEGLETKYNFENYYYNDKFEYVEENGKGKFVCESDSKYFEPYYSTDKNGNDIYVVSDKYVKEFSYDDYLKAYSKNIYKQCGDWYAFTTDLLIKYTSEKQFYIVEFNKETGEYEPVDLELHTESIETTRIYYISIYYNIASKEFSAESKRCHKVEDKSLLVPAVGCEGFGYRVYVCPDCGLSSREYYTNGHEYYFDKDSVAFEEDQNCNHGVSAIKKCRNCDYSESVTVYNHYETYSYTKYTAEELGAKCGGYINFYECLCGEEQGISEYLDCNFQEHWSNDFYYRECVDCHFKYGYTSEEIIDDEVHCLRNRRDHFYFGFERNDYENAKITISYDNYKYYDHNYVEDESRFVEAVGCTGEGERVYVCVSCGDEYTRYYTNGHSYMFVEDSIVFENGHDCEQGVQGRKYCVECGYEEEFHNWGHDAFELKYDIQDLGSTCEGYIILHTCPCGDNLYVSHEFDCDLDYGYVDGNTWYQCAVTDPQCLFEYVYVQEIIGTGDYPCQDLYQNIYYYGTVDGDISTAKLVLYGDTWTVTNHDYVRTDLENTGNHYSYIQECACGTYEKYSYTYNASGDTIKEVIEYYSRQSNYLEITTKELITAYNGSQTYSALLRTKYEHYDLNDNLESLSGYYYVYTYSFDNGCIRTRTEYDYDGTFITEMIDYDYCVFTTTDWYDHKCTGYRGYSEICLICGHVEENNWGVNGHSWEYNEDKGLYECYYCGLENINGVDGDIIFEDSTSENNPDNIVIEYYAHEGTEFLINISIILNNVSDGENDQVVIEDVEYELNEDARYVSFSKNAVVEAATLLGYEEGTYSIRLTFVPLYTDSDLDYSITIE